MRYLALILLILFKTHAFGQFWVSGKLNYQPTTYFPKTDLSYTYHKIREVGLQQRMSFQATVGFKNLYVSYNTFTQKYEIPNIENYNEFDLGLFPFHQRILTFYDVIVGVNYKIKPLSIRAYYIRALFRERREAIIFIPPTNLPHPSFPFYRGWGNGFGINISFTLIENLSVGFNCNYTYYKNLEEKKIFRYNPFVEYKYTF